MSVGRMAAVLLAAAMSPAMAATQPPHTTPTRDVEVRYDLNDQGRHLIQRSVWQAASALQRVDVYGGDGSWVVENGRQLVAAVVNDAKRTVIDARISPGPLNGGKGSFRQLGSMSVAGVACTEWEITVPGDKAAPQQVCLTQDGVPLSLRSGMVEMFRATSVVYRPSDPALFGIPAAYDRTQQ